MTAHTNPDPAATAVQEGAQAPKKESRGAQPHPTDVTTHIYVLLDRSGSMASIRNDVIGGFNAFVAAQQADGDDARLTLVQFDTGNVHDVVYADAPISLVPPLTNETFVPRGGTPLLDATHLVVKLARKHAKARAAVGQRDAVVVVTITDGEENASRRRTFADIRALITQHQAKGWTFVFLSAGLDAYGDAARLGYADDVVQAWHADADGAQVMFESTTRALLHRRENQRNGVAPSPSTFFEGDKPAESR